jgi:hypothetical protein
MGTLEIDNLSFELRKINAIKIRRQPEESEENISEEKQSKEESFPAEIRVGIRQKKDKRKVELYALYTIPSLTEYNLEIDAEFNGLITLKEPFDTEKEDEDSPLIKEFIEKKILPKITREIDKALLPIFRNMNVKYECIAKKSSEDISETKNNT